MLILGRTTFGTRKAGHRSDRTETVKRICLVGAGFIARAHADVLRHLPGMCLAAIIDPNESAAQRLAGSFRAEHVFSSVEAALREDRFDAAHVLVPPPLHHAVALPLLEARVPLLVEKPLADGAEEAMRLVEQAEAKGVMLCVNHNAVQHPAFLRLHRELAAGAIGNPRFVTCVYSMPLRQFSAARFGHWMFARPQNLLLEQAVHPLSQIVALAGAVTKVVPLAGPPAEIAASRPFYPTLDLSLACERVPAQFHFAVGQSFPFWQLAVIGDDGVLTADIVANRCWAHARTRWTETLDHAVSGWRTGGAMILDATRNLVDHSAALLRLRPRADAFFQSMHASIAAFYDALAGEVRPEIDGALGAQLVAACERIAEAAYPKAALAAVRPAAAAKATEKATADIAVLGGTGLIGRQLVARLVADGKRVAVMARSIDNLPTLFDDQHVRLHRGDIADEAAVEAAIGGASVVVNLAHGGGSGSWREVRDAMVGGAETVARVCRRKGVRRLVHIGSIAALYLGPRSEPVTGATAPDPLPEKRADYARAKALCDRMLVDFHAREGLPIVILRPGFVVGSGASPFHSGLGVYNNEQHCLGWNDGRNPLPFVLADDVATAIARACEADGVDGRAFNLVGDVRLNARDYTGSLAAALGRPLRFHPQSPYRLWLIEWAKWIIKRLGGRQATPPSLRDLISRGCRAPFDCSDAKHHLRWQPVSDRATFLTRAFASLATRR